MSYKAEILADSVSPDGVRLTTMRLRFPRFILAELNTHRMLSRNSASSRAIPTLDVEDPATGEVRKGLVTRVRENPFVPETFNKRVKGMGVGEEMSHEDARDARECWISAAFDAAKRAEVLARIGLDKSRANRLLEPFLWHEAIVSATEWENMLALRDHPAAQPEFQRLARLMREALLGGKPRHLGYGQWHLPLVTEEELDRLCTARKCVSTAEAAGGWSEDGTVAWWQEKLDDYLEELKMASASRCARVSYGRDDDEPLERTLARAETLMGNGHFSPFEHVARPFGGGEPMAPSPFGYEKAGAFLGNFRGWVQMRKEIENEDRFDRVLMRQAREAHSR